jgi:predicted nucleotidyltransferase
MPELDLATMEPMTDDSQPRGETAGESRRVLELYRALAQAHLGDELDRIVLFGSRARGDQRADSDWDVAVFLRHPITPSDQRRVSAIGHDVMCETGALIQSVALPAERWNASDEFTRRIRRDGICIHG